MKKTIKKIYRAAFRNKLITPLIELKLPNFPRYLVFFISYIRYRLKVKNNKPKIKDIFPQLEDKTKDTRPDPHYFYQATWTAGKIIEDKPKEHIDVGSQIDLIGFLTNITKVKFVDLRPLTLNLPNLEIIKDDITQLPFPDESVKSLSCLHVAEHIGLGRYGDKLDPKGTEKACHELARILAPGGNLYFSVPIGRERTEFNAHRVHQPETIMGYFARLSLMEFSAVDDHGRLILNAKPLDFRKNRFSCGLFHFKKIK